MSQQVESNFNIQSKLLWLIGLCLISLAVWGNSYFSDIGLLYRVLGVVGILFVSLFVLRFTIFGNQTYNLLIQSSTEIRKVVWPNRTETTQTTLIVTVAVLIASLILWGLDSLFSFLIKLFLGLNMSKALYVINSYSGYENKAKEQLMDRIVSEGQGEYFGRIEVPTQEITEIKGGKEKIVQKKFFPGYILVEMEMNDVTWHLVKETPRVLGFIGGTKNDPKSITDVEANRILNQIENGVDESTQSVSFEPGEMIRVIDGPFNDFSGVVEEVDNEKSKVKVAVMIFGRSTPVELDFTQIERS